MLYQGSTAESQVLQADVESGTPPDVAVLPGPGELAAYARQGRLQPLDGLVAPPDFDAPWAPEVAGPDGRPATYWVPIKTDLKSIVWYSAAADGTRRARGGRGRPRLLVRGHGRRRHLGLARHGLAGGHPAPAGGPGGVPAVGDRRPAVDRAAVRRAWRTWGAMVGAGPGPVRPPGAAPASTTRPPTGWAEHTCSLEHQASFVRAGDALDVRPGAAYVHSTPLIPGSPHARTPGRSPATSPRCSPPARRPGS